MDLANNTFKSIDAIASKLVTSAELDSKAGENGPQVPSSSQANLLQTEINENVFNCSDEISERDASPVALQSRMKICLVHPATKFICYFVKYCQTK